MKHAELYAFQTQLEPGTTDSKHAGFKGKFELVDGTDHQGKPAVLIRMGGWHQYSSKYGHYVYRAGLVVEDETGTHMVRVPYHCETVVEALEWVEPAEIRKAREAGRTVLRQGDFYFYQLTRGRNNFKALVGSRHQAIEDAEGVVVVHEEHNRLLLPVGVWKAVRQKTSNGQVD